jgi:sacsin
LLVYNDSTFRESDFTSISSIGDSVKREQIGKTGRFGVGFNSVYHLTDVPSFVSGRHVVFFDPHATFLPNVSSSNPGKRVDFVKNDVLAKNFDQFAPFLAFGCDARAEFRGTTFRFPLRTKAQAGSSKLSKASYAKDDVRKLLNDFKTEATLDMLFLKNVAAIEISEWRVGDDAPTTLSVSKIQSPSAALVSARGAFARASAAHAEKGALARIEPETASRFDVTFESSEGDAKGTENAVKRRAFVVAQALGSRALHALVTTGREKFGMQLVPWAAVAAELDAANGADSESSSLAEASREPSGRAFCFLPLPVRTGLPVHVNAFFELSSNRRDVWHGGDMSGGGAARSEWNQALLEKVVSPSYVALLLAIKAKVDSGETPLQTYYALFPSGDHAVTKPWDCVVRETCISLSHEAVLHTNAGGGGWIAPRDATFPDHEVERDETLRDALIEEGVAIPDAPTGVLSRLEEHVETPLRASPNGARRILKRAFLTAKHTRMGLRAPARGRAS